MCNQEWKTGPCTLTSKDGKSVLVGDIIALHPTDKDFGFRTSGTSPCTWFYKEDWTPNYPLPALPDKVGSVIESGDGSMMWARASGGTNSLRWAVLRREDGGNFWEHEKDVTDYCASHGGFKVLLEGQ